MLINFTQNDETIFTVVAESVPRVGEVIYYSFTPNDRELWNDDALAGGDAVNNKEFIVIKVSHEFRKMRIMQPDNHCIWIEVSSLGLSNNDL